MCGVGGREGGGGGVRGMGWVIKDFMPRLYTLKYVKFSVCDASLLSRLRLFQHCGVFAHHVRKMPSRRMCENVCVCPALHKIKRKNNVSVVINV